VGSITRENPLKPGGFGLTFGREQGMLRNKVNHIQGSAFEWPTE